MSQVEESIISRIQKLLALSKSDNQSEAELALSRAQDLLAKYNMELSEVQGRLSNADDEERKAEKTSDCCANYQYQRDLWKGLAEANFCWYWVSEGYEVRRGKRTKRPVKRHNILGRVSNIISVRTMAEYLEETMERLLVTEGGFSNSERLSRSAHSWKIGCVERLLERIEEQKAQRESTPGEYGIVLRSTVQTEYEKNYDAKYGAGAYARRLAYQAEMERRWEEQREEREAEWAAAFEEEAKRKANETEAERKKREAREQRQEERERARQKREASKFDYRAYKGGRQTAEGISLAKQVEKSSSSPSRMIS